jgi:hypothetical protein
VPQERWPSRCPARRPSCNGWTAVDDDDATDKLFALGDDCFADGGNNFGGTRPADDPTAAWRTTCSVFA